MKLRSVLDTMDNVPAELHDYYEEKDGKFYLLLDEDIKTHPSVNALSNAYRQEQTKRREAATKLQAAEARLAGLPEDFNSDAYEDLKARAEDNDGKNVDERIQTLKDQNENKVRALETKHGEAIKKKDDEIARLSGAIERNVVETSLSAAMDEANIDPKHKKKLAPYLRHLGKIKVEDQDGKPVAMVETDMGEVSLSKFVSDWAASDDGKEYVGKASGLNTTGSDRRTMEGNPFSKQNWSKTEQGRLVGSDRGKAERLAKAAGFKTLEQATQASAAI